MALHISVVLWKSDSMAVALTARNIGLKVRWTVMTPDEYRQKHKRCATCVYYGENNFFQASPSYYCLAKNKTTFDSKGRFCKVYKAKDFKRGQRISGQNTQG
jgi:hypothetical protein